MDIVRLCPSSSDDQLFTLQWRDLCHLLAEEGILPASDFRPILLLSHELDYSKLLVLGPTTSAQEFKTKSNNLMRQHHGRGVALCQRIAIGSFIADQPIAIQRQV